MSSRRKPELSTRAARSLAISGWERAALAKSAGLFAGSAAEKLAMLQGMLAPLAAQYDVVVANPPYMGSKNMGAWLSRWIKDRYADVKGDLFSCFIVRNLELGSTHAQLGFMTPYVWMFIGTYEKLRKLIIEQHTITSLIQLEYSGFAGATVPICTFTLQKGCLEGYKGGYIRLSDFPGADRQSAKVLEALANPDCGWFYRAGMSKFMALPGSPIAYWASEAMAMCFTKGSACLLGALAKVAQGITTGDNALFLRYWWEIASSRCAYDNLTAGEILSVNKSWVASDKGGEYRKWYGNNCFVVEWSNGGERVRNHPGSTPRNIEAALKPSFSCSKISSGSIAFRRHEKGFVFTDAAVSVTEALPEEYSLMAFCNSSVAHAMMSILAPTLNFEVGQIRSLPYLLNECDESRAATLSVAATNIAKMDWNNAEASWDFKRHPLMWDN